MIPELVHPVPVQEQIARHGEQVVMAIYARLRSACCEESGLDLHEHVVGVLAVVLATAPPRSQLELYRRRIESRTTWVSVTDAQMTIFAVSEYAARELGFHSPSELVGRNAREFVDVGGPARMQELVEDGDHSGLAIGSRRDGTRFELFYEAKTREVNGQQLYVANGEVQPIREGPLTYAEVVERYPTYADTYTGGRRLEWFRRMRDERPKAVKDMEKQQQRRRWRGG